jgi:broad specificity phosphatase PhoE
VSHGEVIRVLIADALGLDLGRIARIEQSHCCLNIMEYLPEGALLRLLNS